jgi:hypothetical protein
MVREKKEYLYIFEQFNYVVTYYTIINSRRDNFTRSFESILYLEEEEEEEEENDMSPTGEGKWVDEDCFMSLLLL